MQTNAPWVVDSIKFKDGYFKPEEVLFGTFEQWYGREKRSLTPAKCEGIPKSVTPTAYEVSSGDSKRISRRMAESDPNYLWKCKL